MGRLGALGTERADLAAEQERVETLILSGDAPGWLTYLRRRETLVGELTSGSDGGVSDGRALDELLTILIDQFELIQVALELGSADLAAKRRLEKLAAGRGIRGYTDLRGDAVRS